MTYTLVEKRMITATSWTGEEVFRDSIDFNAVKLNFINYITDQSGLLYIHLKLNGELTAANVGRHNNGSNFVLPYFYGTVLDTRNTVNVYQESILTPVKLETEKRTFRRLAYEIYINLEPSYSGIDALNPVTFEIEFLKI